MEQHGKLEIPKMHPKTQKSKKSVIYKLNTNIAYVYIAPCWNLSLSHDMMREGLFFKGLS